MTAPDSTTQRILEVIVRTPNSALEEVVLECPELTWNQVFLIVDQLSRAGIIKLIPKAPGIYTIHLLSIPEPARRYHSRA